MQFIMTSKFGTTTSQPRLCHELQKPTILSLMIRIRRSVAKVIRWSGQLLQKITSLRSGWLHSVSGAPAIQVQQTTWLIQTWKNVAAGRRWRQLNIMTARPPWNLLSQAPYPQCGHVLKPLGQIRRIFASNLCSLHMRTLHVHSEFLRV